MAKVQFKLPDNIDAEEALRIYKALSSAKPLMAHVCDLDGNLLGIVPVIGVHVSELSESDREKHFNGMESISFGVTLSDEKI